jgi:hypothetical protein
MYYQMKKIIQYSPGFYLVLLLLVSGLLTENVMAQSKGISQWASLNSTGKLSYKVMEKGDKIMDFSFAGYMGGGVSFPDVPVALTVSPVGSDDAIAIQDAIDQVTKMALVNGKRGTVLLKAGTYNCTKSLTISASGVVLRGSGSDENGTVINMTGDAHTGVTVKGSTSSTVIGKPVSFTDDYVPSGATSFSVRDATTFKIDDKIRITRPVTDIWVHFMGMDNLVRDGKKQSWVGKEITTERTIIKIEGNKITVGVPLADSFDAGFLAPDGATIVKLNTTSETSQIGVENLRIVSQPKVATITESNNKGLSVNGAVDVWLKNIVIINTINSVSINGNRVTAENINIQHTVATIGAAKPADFVAGGRQILFDRCTVKGDNLFYFATAARITGPTVLLNCVFNGNGWIQPHQRWSTGLLVDGCKVPDGGIDFMNRGEMGSGHGWTIAWAVAWNCQAKRFINQNPPGAANWVIGGKGAREQASVPFSKSPLLPDGNYDSHGTPVAPLSLYLTQLAERLGPQALKNIGY